MTCDLFGETRSVLERVKTGLDKALGNRLQDSNQSANNKARCNEGNPVLHISHMINRHQEMQPRTAAFVLALNSTRMICSPVCPLQII